MYDFSYFIDFLFRAINFVLLILLLRYLFKRFALPVLKNKIEQRRQMIRSLEEHLTAVQHQESLWAGIIDQEAGLSNQIEKKMLRWADSIAAELRMRNREKEQIMRKIQAHQEERENALALLKAHEIIFPRVLSNVEHMLKQEAEDPNVGAFMIERIMRRIRAKNND